jgi:hypothetical protein
LFVVKFDFAVGVEYLWINPSTNSTPSTANANASLAMTSSFKSGGINQVILAAGFNTASFNYDECASARTFSMSYRIMDFSGERF